MPPVRKIDLIAPELQSWLKSELEARGFSGYVELASDLNTQLLERGEEITIGKSAVAEFGAEHKEMVKLQSEASEWAATWMDSEGLDAEAKRHEVLFQMITTLAFKVLKSQLTKDGDDIKAQDLHFLGKMMKDVMSSSGIREKITGDERERLRAEAIEEQEAEQKAKIENAVVSGDIEKEAAQRAREILGFG